MNDLLIIWQKWVDPFGDDDNYDLENNNSTNIFVNEEDTEESEKESEPNLYKKLIGIKAIATPMGIIPMNENTASGKIFNFWIGHTNFNITKKIALMIEKTDGVETLDIFTRYRFRISIGKAFNDSDVMRNINKKIYKEISV